jgi:hypothetical protein
MQENILFVLPLVEKIQVAAFKFDFDSKIINQLWHKEISNDKDLKKFKKLCSLVFYPNTYKIIFALEPNKIVSFYKRVVYSRLDFRKNIDESELDGLVSDIFLQLFNEGRREAVERLNIQESDVILVHAGIYNFLLDGEITKNPLGMSGKKIEFCFNEIFLDRHYFEFLTHALPKRVHEKFFLGIGEAAAYILYSFFKKENFIFAKVNQEDTDLFIVQGNKICFLEYLLWGEKNLLVALANALHVSPLTALGILEKVLRAEVSMSFKKKVQGFIKDELMVLVNNLQKKMKHYNVPLIYTNFPILLVPKIFPKIIKNVDAHELISSSGFVFNRQLAKQWNNFDFSMLIAFLAATWITENDLVNRLIQRRIRWLTPYLNM